MAEDCNSRPPPTNFVCDIHKTLPRLPHELKTKVSPCSIHPPNLSGRQSPEAQRHSQMYTKGTASLACQGSHCFDVAVSSPAYNTYLRPLLQDRTVLWWKPALLRSCSCMLGTDSQLLGKVVNSSACRYGNQEKKYQRGFPWLEQ